jgi:hypothetical protein
MKLHWCIVLTIAVFVLVSLGFTALFVPLVSVIQNLSSHDKPSAQVRLPAFTAVFMGVPFRVALLGLNVLSFIGAIRGVRRYPLQGLPWALLIAFNVVLLIPNAGQAFVFPKFLAFYHDLGIK